MKTLVSFKHCSFIAGCILFHPALYAQPKNSGTADVTSGDLSSTIALQDQQIQHTVLLTLIPVVVAFSFFVFVFYRTQREAFFKQKETNFKLSLSELELKALRAQINPHFIFNCLNSIHHYMHQNDVKHAGDYLVKFSQLIRYVLETSSSRMVPLSDDLEALKIYMELEQLRMQQSFTFTITVEDTIRQDDVCIPAMMMQPFVENSIWHGLVNKAEGVISIHLKKQGNIIECLIDDNGQRNVGTGNKSITIKKTSMGMSLIKERLEVVRQIFNVNADFEMLDLKSGDGTRAGTRISLRLPFEE